MIKVVLFDIDNTLLSFDGCVKQALKEGFAKYNIIEYKDEMFYTFKRINDSLWIRLEKGEITFSDIKANRFNLVFKELGVAFDGPTFEAYFRECLFNNAIPIEGSLEILDYLKDKYVLGVASNGPYKQQLNRLKVAKMIDYFSYFFISEDLGASKPSQEYIDKVLEKMPNYKREEILIVGDSLTSDIKLGIIANMKTCYFNPNNKEYSKEYKIDYVINSLRELKNII